MWGLPLTPNELCVWIMISTWWFDAITHVAVLLVPFSWRILHFHFLQGGGQESAVSVGRLRECLLGQDERPSDKFSILTGDFLYQGHYTEQYYPFCFHFAHPHIWNISLLPFLPHHEAPTPHPSNRIRDCEQSENLLGVQSSSFSSLGVRTQVVDMASGAWAAKISSSAVLFCVQCSLGDQLMISGIASPGCVLALTFHISDTHLLREWHASGGSYAISWER